jgi:hypothetical protein
MHQPSQHRQPVLNQQVINQLTYYKQSLLQLREALLLKRCCGYEPYLNLNKLYYF